MFNLILRHHTPKSLLLRYCFLLSTILLFYSANAQTFYKVDQLPNPKVNGNTNVANPDGLLPTDAVDSLNTLATAMKQSTGVELAIAVVNNYNQDQDDFSFAANLFRKWRVGGEHSNNGLLLFVAVERKQYRFITGYGLEGPLPDVVLADVGRHYLMPAFKEGAYSHGIIKAITVIDAYLRQPDNQKDLQALLARDGVAKPVPWYYITGGMVLLVLVYILLIRHLKKKVPALPKKKFTDTEGYEKRIAAIVVGLFISCFVAAFLLAFTIGFAWIKRLTLMDGAYILYGLLMLAFALRYLYALSIIRKSHADDFNYNTAAYQFQLAVWWYVLFSPLVLVLIISEAIKRKKDQSRLAPQIDKDGHQLTRVDRDKNPTGAPYLTAGQQTEEKDGVYSYDIWLDSTTNNYKVVANEGRNFGKFDECPKCHFKTLAHPVVETLVASTYTSKGKGQKVSHCSFCQHVVLIKMVTLPVRSQSSDNSSSSGSGGGSSSSSSSASFGGGNTGGGGAGGTW